MIPSENTANLVSAPPENRSMNWSADSCCPVVALRSSASRLGSTLGTGMCEPSRNTAMMPMVNRIFLRRSGILNELTKAFSMVRRFLERRSAEKLSLQAEDLHGASCLLDLALGRGRDSVHPDGQGLVQLALPQDLHRGPLPDHAPVPEQLGRDLGAAFEGFGEAPHVHHGPRHAVGVGEPLQLGNAALERHLAALEAGLGIVAGSVALGAPAGRLPLPGGLSSTQPASRANGSLGGAQVVDLHVASPSTSATLTRWATLAIMPRTSGRSSWRTEWRIRSRPSLRMVAF